MSNLAISPNDDVEAIVFILKRRRVYHRLREAARRGNPCRDLKNPLCSMKIFTSPSVRDE